LEGAQYSFAERRRGGGHGGYQVDDQGAWVRQLQLLLRLPLPIQWIAHAL